MRRPINRDRLLWAVWPSALACWIFAGLAIAGVVVDGRSTHQSLAPLVMLGAGAVAGACFLRAERIRDFNEKIEMILELRRQAMSLVSDMPDNDKAFEHTLSQYYRRPRAIEEARRAFRHIIEYRRASRRNFAGLDERLLDLSPWGDRGQIALIYRGYFAAIRGAQKRNRALDRALVRCVGLVETTIDRSGRIVAKGAPVVDGWSDGEIGYQLRDRYRDLLWIQSVLKSWGRGVGRRNLRVLRQLERMNRRRMITRESAEELIRRSEEVEQDLLVRLERATRRYFGRGRELRAPSV